MTQDEIIEAAIQGHASTRDAIRWAIQREREACAKICDKLQDDIATEPKHCAETIRARGKANTRSNTSWALMCKKMVEDEREACLRIQEDWQCVYASDLVQKIRARGEA
jgi:hypothetical protein